MLSTPLPASLTGFDLSVNSWVSIFIIFKPSRFQISYLRHVSPPGPTFLAPLLATPFIRLCPYCHFSLLQYQFNCAYIDLFRKIAGTYDHRLERIGHPVRSAILKLQIGRLVVGWVTTSEYLLLYVFASFLDLASSKLCRATSCPVFIKPCSPFKSY